jgi:hypothetical protein
VNVIHDRTDGRTESTISGLVVPYSPEYRDLEANEYLLTQLSQVGGGARLQTAAQVFGSNRPIVFAPLELYRWLLFLAMLLFPLDVAVRRLALERSDFARAWEWVRLRGRPRERDFAATPELARLKSVKERAFASADAGYPAGVELKSAKIEPRNPKPEPVRTASRPAAESVPRPVPTRTTEEPGAEAQPELTGMSRLMAAKQRAKEQQKPKDAE